MPDSGELFPARPMAETLFDKIWRRHVVKRFNADEALLYIDRVLLHEGANHAFRTLAAMNRARAVRATPSPVPIITCRPSAGKKDSPASR